MAAPQRTQWPQHTIEEYIDVMLRYKVEPCKDPACEKGWACFGYHNPTERRRPPRGRLADKARKCPDMTTTAGQPRCPRGDACPYFHTMAEWFHPSAYKRGRHPEGEGECRVTLRNGDPLFCSFMHEDDDRHTIAKAREIALERAERSAKAGGTVTTLMAAAAAPLPESAEARRKAKEEQKAREDREWRAIDERKKLIEEFPELTRFPGALGPVSASQTKQAATAGPQNPSQQQQQQQQADAALSKKERKKRKKAAAKAQQPLPVGDVPASATQPPPVAQTPPAAPAKPTAAAVVAAPRPHAAVPAPSPSPSKQVPQRYSPVLQPQRYNPALQPQQQQPPQQLQQPQQQQPQQLPSFSAPAMLLDSEIPPELDGALEDDYDGGGGGEDGDGAVNMLGDPVFLRGVVTHVDAEHRMGFVNSEGKSFIFHEHSQIGLGWRGLRTNDELVVVPEPTLSEMRFPEVFAWSMTKSGTKASSGAYMAQEDARRVLRTAWNRAFLILGTVYPGPGRQTDLKPFAILRSATMRDLRSRIAALTGIPSHNQFIMTADFVLPDEDEKRLDQTPIAQSEGPGISLIVRNESRLIRWARFDNIDGDMRSLEMLAAHEFWGEALEVLHHYVKTIFAAAIEQNLVMWGHEDIEGRQEGRPATLACFNTALFTPANEQIFGVFEILPENAVDMRQWRFQSWEKEPGIAQYFQTLPAPPEFCKTPCELVFQPKLKFSANVEFILADPMNKRQLEEIFRVLSITEQMQRRAFTTALAEAKKRVKQNFRIALPQVSDGTRLGFLLPLSFGGIESVHVALSVLPANKGGPLYIGHSLVPLPLAYMNARVVSPPSSNWLCDAMAVRAPQNSLQLYRSCISWSRLVEAAFNPSRDIEKHATVVQSVQLSFVELMRKVYLSCGVQIPAPEVGLLTPELQRDTQLARLAPAQATAQSLFFAVGALCEPEAICPACGNALLRERDPETGDFASWRCSACSLPLKE